MRRLTITAVLPIAGLLFAGSLYAAAGTTKVATAGRDVDGRPSWPDGTIGFLNNPLRTEGWNDWFSEWPSDVHHYQFQPTSMEQVNRIVADFAEISSDSLHVRLLPLTEPRGFGWVSRLPEGNATPVMFSIGDQSVIDAWYQRIPDGKFGVMEFETVPVAVPPTLTIYAGHPIIDIDALVVPENIEVTAAGKLPHPFHEWNLRKQKARQPGKNASPPETSPRQVPPSRQAAIDAIRRFLKVRQSAPE